MTPSQEVSAAVGEAEDLEAQAERLRRKLAEQQAPERELAAVERQIQERDAAALKAAATLRLRGIVSALGGLATVSQQDDLRLWNVATEYATVMTTVNERFRKIRMYQHEAAALVEAFGLPAPELPMVVVPCQRPLVREAEEIAARVHPGDGAFFFVTPQTDREGRRTFRELDGTEGGALIQRKPSLTRAA